MLNSASTHKFSLTAKDQLHEHSNPKLQAGGGELFDIYDDTDMITLYMFAGPDTVRLTNEFEGVQVLHNSPIGHHEESSSLQRRFIKEFLECEPFLETGNELIAIDTRAVIEHEVVMSLDQIQGVDEALHGSYVQARIL